MYRPKQKPSPFSRYRRGFQTICITRPLRPAAKIRMPGNGALQLREKVDVEQNSCIDKLILSIVQKIEYLLQYFMLQARNLNVTGTPVRQQ